METSAACSGDTPDSIKRMKYTPGAFQVITFNVWRDQPFDALSPSLNPPEKTIKQYQPWGDDLGPRKKIMLDFFRTYAKLEVDIFGLQECTDRMLSEIMECLPEYECPFSGQGKVNQEQIFYRKDRFDIIAKLSYNWEQTSNHYSILKLRLKDVNKEIIVANTHLNWQGHGSWTAATGPGPNPRASQMNDLADAVMNMQGVATQDFVLLPVIVMGDLNDIFAPLQVAFERLEVKPSFILTKPPTVSPHTCPTPSGDPHEGVDSWGAKTYDWILSKFLDVIDTARIDFNKDGVYPSDHYPVIAKYML